MDWNKNITSIFVFLTQELQPLLRITVKVKGQLPWRPFKKPFAIKFSKSDCIYVLFKIKVQQQEEQ